MGITKKSPWVFLVNCGYMGATPLTVHHPVERGCKTWI